MYSFDTNIILSTQDEENGKNSRKKWRSKFSDKNCVFMIRIMQILVTLIDESSDSSIHTTYCQERKEKAYKIKMKLTKNS